MNGFMGGGGAGGLNAGYMPGTAIGGAMGGAYQTNMVGMELYRQMAGLMEHYQYNKYIWYYHRSTNQLEIKPSPRCEEPKWLTLDLFEDGSLGMTTMENPSCSVQLSAGQVNSAGFALIKTYMIEGAGLPTYTPPVTGVSVDSIFNIHDHYSDFLFNEPWIIDYVTARCKITLGNLRRKFAQFGSLGNQGISLDGDSLVSEGKEEVLRLEEELPLKHAYEGYGIYLM
jgi:hypothetical protein